MGNWPSGDLSQDEAYALVAEQRRRETLRVLLHEHESWDVSTLAAEVAAREADISRAAVDEETQKRVVVALLHRDLPKLAETGVVTSDFTEETVRPGSNIDDVDQLL